MNQFGGNFYFNNAIENRLVKRMDQFDKRLDGQGAGGDTWRLDFINFGSKSVERQGKKIRGLDVARVTFSFSLGLVVARLV